VLGVLYQDNADAARRFEARFGNPTWPSLLDPSGALALDFGVTGPPESYFVDATGIVRDKVFGPLTTSVLDTKLRVLLDR
jgi:cytochrome c biogenesis protein CcmG/thiol:disulfide interchange protein DsbE